jgi:signal transduction histidine kinase
VTSRRIHWLAVPLLLLLAGCGSVPSSGVLTIDAARMLPGQRETPPPPDATGWETRQLPDVWTYWRRQLATEAWYRADVMLPQAPDELWSLYLPRAAMAVEAYVNGHLVGATSAVTEPMPRGWNQPQLYSIPTGLLHQGANVLDLRLRMNPSSPGLLAPFHVGPERLLRPVYTSRVFAQVTLVQIASMMTLGMALLIAGIYLRRDQFGAYRWMVPAVAAWAFTSVDAYVVHIPVTTALWEWLQATSQNACVCCFIVAFHRMQDLRRPRVEIGLAVQAAVFTAIFFLASPIHRFSVVVVWGIATIALAIYLMTLVMPASRLGRLRSARGALVPGLIAIACGVHDVASVITGRLLFGILLTPYLPALGMLAGGWSVLTHLSDGLTQAETLNRELERRVRDKAAELERNYDRLRQLEGERAVAQERDRIMRDMHDGMGGQLVSTLALVESGRATPDGIADAIRDALDDLRLVIDSLDPVEEDLLAVLGVIRGRLEPRLRRNGIDFAWQVTDLPAIPGFGPDRVLQALRIVQEAITNVIKHAGAHTITVRTGREANGVGPGVFVEIADDGGGIDPTRPEGRGLRNMRRRAASLGGQVTIASTGVGTAVRLWLPLAA